MDTPKAPKGPRPRRPVQIPLPNIPETVVPDTVMPISGAELALSEADPVDISDDDPTWADVAWESRLSRLTRRAVSFFKRKQAA